MSAHLDQDIDLRKNTHWQVGHLEQLCPRRLYCILDKKRYLWADYCQDIGQAKRITASVTVGLPNFFLADHKTYKHLMSHPGIQ